MSLDDAIKWSPDFEITKCSMEYKLDFETIKKIEMCDEHHNRFTESIGFINGCNADEIFYNSEDPEVLDAIKSINSQGYDEMFSSP